MNVLLIYAHPEPRSLNGALKDLAVNHLTALGHEVRVSDLYAMGWKAVADGADFLNHDARERLSYVGASKHAFANGSQSPDIEAEQEKLLWADAVLFQFPMWWFSMPAILKGWIDRVFAYGFAYGVGEHGGERWGDRYGEGTLVGRRAMLSVTIGGRAPHYTERGVNGALDDLLFPIQHGVLFYPGMEVLPPFTAYHVDRLTEEQWPSIAAAFKARLDGLFTDDVIPFRRQNGGHYDTQQVLKPGLGHAASGTSIHLVKPGEPEQLPVEVSPRATGTR
ncbi:NAD(P)H-dependent oxidoreductase [Myxococcus sp. CA033]|uniref:NAD(P)H-dependent oxidoreductase n=1 Tax=Myxococcus sp. CA033 TaxID=2741516 RepID=UPI00157A386F|nr:NAD(P)H-dependent oxidoreductase [Myxococcus sp. CA033]NTX35878.1 NAD(P)H-dependent oxidoreductase [Myxococcus sp. CA033]